MMAREWFATLLIALAVVGYLIGVGPADATTPGDPFIGVKVSASSNQRSGPDGIIDFDTVHFETGGDFYYGPGGAIHIPITGCYSITAQVTVLGYGYYPDSTWSGGAPGSNPAISWWLMSVTRNGDPHDFLAATGLTNTDKGGAQLSDASTVACLTAGDYVELRVSPNILVESNWPDTGGSISPILSLVYEGSLAP